MKNRVFIFGLFILSFSGSLNAQNLYVSDQLEAALRRGEGLQFKVIKMVRSGEVLVVLKQNKSGYTKVRTSTGKVGYILSRYLMPEAAARTLVEDYTNKNNQLNTSVLSLEQKVGQLEAAIDKQDSQFTTLQGDKNKLDTELADIQAATADVMAIKHKNAELEKELELQTKEIDELLVDNKAYRNNTKQDWFLRGAGVILLGIFIGLILPNLRKKRRWGEF